MWGTLGVHSSHFLGEGTSSGHADLKEGKKVLSWEERGREDVGDEGIPKSFRRGLPSLKRKEESRRRAILVARGEPSSHAGGKGGREKRGVWREYLGLNVRCCTLFPGEGDGAVAVRKGKEISS